MKRKHLKEILIAISLANLLFLMGWRKVIYLSSPLYFIKYPPTYLDHLALIFLILSLAAVFLGGLWAGKYLSGGTVPRLLKWVFLLSCLCVLNVIRIIYYNELHTFVIDKIDKTVYLILVGSALIAGAVVLIKWSNHVFTFLQRLLLVLFPFAVVTFLLSFLAIASYEEPAPFNASVSQNKPKPAIKSRVIWILFDELDYRVTFEDLPRDVELPEFNRLRRESLFATRAVAAQRDTKESVPSLLTGKRVSKSTPASNNKLLLAFEDGGEQADFSEVPTVFSEVREMQGDTAAVGWFIRYCDSLKKDLSACRWEGDVKFHNHNKSFQKALTTHLTEFVLTMPFGYRLYQAIDPDQMNKFLTKYDRGISRYHILMDESKKVAVDPNIDLALLHLPAPHAPYYYNRKTRDFSGSQSYFDNLVLADLMLGEIRRKIEEAGLWEDSVVIVSSDHQWRVGEHAPGFKTEEEIKATRKIEDPRVPFFVKLKNQKDGTEYNKSFNAVVTKDLILALMKGEISTPEGVQTWLDSKAGNQ